MTGATAGLGYYAAEELASLGYNVVLAARNLEKAADAKAAIMKKFPLASVQIVKLDLADAASIDTAAKTLLEFDDLEGLLLNAGVVGSRTKKLTTDGFELQIGTGFLGHFRLLAQLLPTVMEKRAESVDPEPSTRSSEADNSHSLEIHDQKEPEPLRIVHLGSISHRWIRLHPRRLISQKYRNFVSYATSKLAVMTAGYELARLAEEKNLPLESVLVHPGFAWDHFDREVPEFMKKRPLPWWLVFILTPFAQGKRQGAEALVAGITRAENLNGAYLGPDGIFYGSKGNVKVGRARPKVYRRVFGTRLWKQAEELTNLSLRL